MIDSCYKNASFLDTKGYVRIDVWKRSRIETKDGKESQCGHAFKRILGLIREFWKCCEEFTEEEEETRVVHFPVHHA